ncbi:MAG: STAS domain-containing protein [Xanthomonadales bacterium]|nr:STAS domain-containing protein [Xanthomonadales bacterium]
MALTIGEEQVGPVCLLVLAGRLDTDTSADLELATQDLLQAGHRRFVIDLAGVGYVSSAGLRVLLGLAKAVDGGGSLRLAALNAGVRQVFDVAGFTPLFRIHADRADALAREAAAAGPLEAKPTPASAPAEAAPAQPAEGHALAARAATLLGAQDGSGTKGKADPELVAAAARLLGAGRK